MTKRTSTSKPDKGDTFNNELLPDKIGQNLKQIYDDVLGEPVPDDFLALLKQADEKQSGE